jgi:hypothetical protein
MGAIIRIVFISSAFEQRSESAKRNIECETTSKRRIIEDEQCQRIGGRKYQLRSSDCYCFSEWSRYLRRTNSNVMKDERARRPRPLGLKE